MGRVNRVVLVVLAACGSGNAEPDPPPPAPPPVKPDAAVAVVEPQPPQPQPAPVDAAGTHLDDDGLKKPALAPVKHASHPIDITLRSTPSGARVLVDGMYVGVTPTYWSGSADGMPHVFAFVYEPAKKGAQRYALAQYKFVPITSGVIHARLEPIASDDPSAKP